MNVCPGKIGFDNAKYIKLQSENIVKRAERFGKLYLEVGGKLFQDLHAGRVLPGFDPDIKLRMLRNLGDKIEMVVCVYAGDIEHSKFRADFGTTYDNEVLRMLDRLREWGFLAKTVVMTRFEPSMKSAAGFARKLRNFGLNVVIHEVIPGYPDNVDKILSDEGCGRNAFIKTVRPIVAVIAPGPMSGKFATCLSQLYYENKNGLRAGYAKLETFPVWNLPLNHPVNIAYEAATADLLDENKIDTFHADAYGTQAVTYNRDMEAFPILRELLSRLMGGDVYRSPTDMGVNCVGFAISDDKVVSAAARQEVIRRHLQAACDMITGRAGRETLNKTAQLKKQLGLKDEDRPVVIPAREAARAAMSAKGKGFLGIYCGAAIQLRDGTIVTGKNSPLMHAASSMIINALKHTAGIPDWLHLLPANYIRSIKKMKISTFNQTASSLDVSELLIALGICAANSNAAELAIRKLPELNGCEVHLTHMMGPGDADGLRRIGVRVTADPQYPTKRLFEQ